MYFASLKSCSLDCILLVICVSGSGKVIGLTDFLFLFLFFLGDYRVIVLFFIVCWLMVLSSLFYLPICHVSCISVVVTTSQVVLVSVEEEL